MCIISSRRIGPCTIVHSQNGKVFILVETRRLTVSTCMIDYFPVFDVNKVQE
jgi:hypothetical protein